MMLTFIMSVLRQLLPVKGEEGASLVEYALLLLFIVVVALVAIIVIGNITATSINDSTNTINLHVPAR